MSEKQALLDYHILFRTGIMLAVLWILIGQHARGQEGLNQRTHLSSVKPDSGYALDPWTISPSIKVMVNQVPLSESEWHFDQLQGEWSWRPGSGIPSDSLLESVTIFYNVLPFGLDRNYYSRRLVPVDSAFLPTKSTSVQKAKDERITEEDLFGDVELEKSGSLARGFTVGTNKDLSLESGLRFELNGKLTENLDVIANLTDKSTPIQPEGSTQNLREFDKVFIQVKSSASHINLGDVDIDMQQSEFAQFSRRLQGASGATKTRYGNFKGAVSAARGKFRTMQFDGRDGVQGPYRLTGEQGERFITVLAGSERVYINGERVHRGEENAYTIDYGLGELSFTSNQIITDHTRITVDFQYINRDYNRSLLAAQGREDSLLDGKLSLTTTLVREADSDNLGAQLSLTESELDILREAGDDEGKMVISGADSLGRQPEANVVLYTKIDTVVQGEQQTIFKNVPGDSANVYRVRFSHVGENEGSYRRVGSAVNGILYRWVGKGNGAYAPIRRIPAPIKSEMLSLRSSYKLVENIVLFGEWAGSRFDKNRFSALDDNDNDDLAYLGGVRLDSVETGVGILDASIKQRFTGRRFQTFGRTRDIEFDRKWNITETGNPADVHERISEMQVDFMPFEDTRVGIDLGKIGREIMNSRRQQLRLQTREEGYPGIVYKIERINSRNRPADEKGKWIRQKGNVQYPLEGGTGTWTPSFAFDQEIRRQQSIATDTLHPLSEKFYELGPGLAFKKGNLKVQGSYTVRQSQDLLDQRLQPESKGTIKKIGFQYSPGQYFQTNNELALRDKNFTEKFERKRNARDSRGVFIRSSNRYAIPGRFMEGQFLYKANTERRAILQETYVNVGPEIGQYVWRDINGDGAQQIDEFFRELSPNEGIYVKQLVPSDELFPVIDLHLRFRNSWDASALFEGGREKQGWRKWVSGMKLNSSIEIKETNTTEKLTDIYLLNLEKFRNDSTTLDGRLYWQQDLRLFTRSDRFDLRFQANQNRSLNRKAVGTERRKKTGYRMLTSYRVGEKVVLKNDLRLSRNRLSSERLFNRNYAIRSRTIKPGTDLIISRSARIGIDFSWAKKSDTFSERNTQVDMFKVVARSQAYLFNRIQANLRLEWRHVNMEGQSTSLGAYELTEGSGRGTSWRWHLSGSYRINNLLRASLNYDGRTSGREPLIQTMRFAINATF